MSESTIRFGTDGWRAIIGDEFTFANVRVCAQATATYLRDTGLASRGVVVGYDTRFLSEEFARTVAEVMAENDIAVHLCDRPAPTPVIGYSILTKRSGGAVVITSSHNPPAYSGFKVRTEYAGSAPPEVLDQIESRLPAASAHKKPGLSKGAEIGNGLVELFDPQPEYLGHIAGLLELERIRGAALRIVVDPMHGAGAGYLAGLLSEGSTQVREIRSERNPAFPSMHNPEPIPRNLDVTVSAIRDFKADLALATDGDADRLGLLDQDGEFVNQLQTFALLAYYLLEVRAERGPLVKSVTTTSMIKRLGELYDVPVHETGVGFKYLGPKMIETDALIAGEESGGFAFRGHMPERDGILSGLYILDLMARRNKNLPELLEELFAKVGPHYYDRIDIEMDETARPAVQDRLGTLHPDRIAGLAVTGLDRTDGYRFLLDDGAWALIRLSGTEPLMRIYTEVRRQDQVQPVLAAVRGMTGV